MQFLAIKKHQRERKDGRPHAQAFVVVKNRKYGDVLEQRCIKSTKPILITGANASGKSYWLDRLHEDAARIWARIDAKPLYFSATRPLSAWTDVKQLELWWAYRKNPDEDRHWAKLKAWERVDWVPAYLRETGAVLFIDDAHNLSGRKLKLAQACVRTAKVWVIAATDEVRLAPGLRQDVLAAEPQTYRLDSEVAYDATSILMWFLMLACLLGGAYEVAMVLGGFKMLSGGRRASKQS
jgi:hypothetical protein